MNSGTDLIPGGDKKLFLSKQTLLGYGCKNCLWKSHGQCPHGFTEIEQGLDDGYCTELVEFIFGLADGEDSISAVKEKFLIYSQEIESLIDHTEFKRSRKEYEDFRGRRNELIAEIGEEEYNSRLSYLYAITMTNKTWWARLTNDTIKNLGRISDRERKSKDIQGDSKITVQQLNVLLKESDKKVKELK